MYVLGVETYLDGGTMRVTYSESLDGTDPKSVYIDRRIKSRNTALMHSVWSLYPASDGAERIIDPEFLGRLMAGLAETIHAVQVARIDTRYISHPFLQH